MDDGLDEGDGSREGDKQKILDKGGKPAGYPVVLWEVGYERKIFKSIEVSEVFKKNESKKKKMKMLCIEMEEAVNETD